MPDSLVVNAMAEDDNTKNVTGGWSIDMEKYGGIIVVMVLIVIVASVSYCKSDSFASPDGVVARRSQNQKRSDTQVDKTWNLKQLEKAVALINRKA
jgi:hypothetical protein